MNNNSGKGREIFYGVIGVATLVVAIIGATFAYFTAQSSNEETITGNAATVALSVDVEKVTHADDTSGLIPMSNSMVEAAVGHAKTESEDGSNVCKDDNGNAVCQIYKITLSNTSDAGIFVDGYVALINGSGTPTDYADGTDNPTTMRWAQVFVKDTYLYTTAGKPDLHVDGDGGPSFSSIGVDAEADGSKGQQAGMNKDNIKTTGVTEKVSIDGSQYDVINTNYIRVSDHKFKSEGTLDPEEEYVRGTDDTSALVYNQKVDGSGSAIYYVVVWLSETGTDQTIGTDGAAEEATNFFSGQVKFISAQGGEVSATFSGYNRVEKPAA